MPSEYKKETKKPDVEKYITPDTSFGESNIDRNFIKNAHIHGNDSSKHELRGEISAFKQGSSYNVTGEAHYKKDNGSIFSLGTEYDSASGKKITVGFEKGGEGVAWSGDVSVGNKPEANIGIKISF